MAAESGCDLGDLSLGSHKPEIGIERSFVLSTSRRARRKWLIDVPHRSHPPVAGRIPGRAREPHFLPTVARTLLCYIDLPKQFKHHTPYDYSVNANDSDHGIENQAVGPAESDACFRASQH